jgi:pimeloyl-ACP methyl ester carboxylesterase
MLPTDPGLPADRVAPGRDSFSDEFFVHVPPQVGRPLRVLVTLHGMGGEGRAFCTAFLQRTDREGWVVVAPTFAYGDWHDPTQVTREESTRFLPRLHDFLETLPARSGLQLEPRVLLYGYSRGAQLADRFALVYPEQTRGVAALSAGTYTLPLGQFELDGQMTPLPYPFGITDLPQRFGREFDLDSLRQVPFWIGVGDLDRNPADLPRRWDPYLGETRVARAESFARRLNEAGVQGQLTVFPDLDHTATDVMSARALEFLSTLP